MLALNGDIQEYSSLPQDHESPGGEKTENREDYHRSSPEPHDSQNYLEWASNLLEQSNDFMEAFDFSDGQRKGQRKLPNALPKNNHSSLNPNLSHSGMELLPLLQETNVQNQNQHQNQHQTQHQTQHLTQHLNQQHNQTLNLNPNLNLNQQHNLNLNLHPSQKSTQSQQHLQHNLPANLQSKLGLNLQPNLPASLSSVHALPPNLHMGLPKELQSHTLEHVTSSDKNYALPPHLQPQPRPPRPQLPWGSTDRQAGGIRSKRPCDHCRRRKTKCVVVPGARNCVQCETKSLICTYLPTKADDEPTAKRARAHPAPSPQLEQQYRTQNMEIVPPNVPIRDVAPVQDYSLMSKSLLRKTLSLQFPRSSYYVGPTSYLYDTNIMDVIIEAQNKPAGGGGAYGGGSNSSSSSKIEQVNLTDSVSLRKVGTNTQFILKDDQSKQSYLDMSNDVDAIEKFVAPHGQILIDLYFRIIHPSYPILHKKVFLEKYSRTHREFSALVLAAVYVLAIQWWDYDPQLNRFPKPNVRLILKIALNNYMLDILKRPKLSAVQGGLLLLQCKRIIRDSGTFEELLSWTFSDCGYNDWVLCSQVIALAEELGLGLDCDHWKLPKWERGLRKRLSWAVFIEHQWLALKNARPTHIDSNNWEVLQLVEEDFPEKHGDGDLKEGSADINNGKKNFTNLILLSQILSEIVTSLYSMRAMREITEIEDVLRIAKPIQLKLRNWYHSLPVELQMNSVQPRKLCPNGYLQLAYFATELTLHRKIITVLHQLALHGKSIPNEITDVCRTAAKTRLIASVEFVRDLKPEHIHSFWHSSSSENFTLIGTFAALLFTSSLSKQEADYYRDQIFNYRWILKISSKGFVQVGEALQKLDLVLNHIPGLLNENADQPMVVPNVPTIDYSKVYQQQMLQSLPQSQALVDSMHLSANPNPQQFTNRHGFSPSNAQYSFNPNGVNSNSTINKPRNNAMGNSHDNISSGDDLNSIGKIPDITTPSSVLQYRASGLGNSPYASPQASNAATFSAVSGGVSRSNQGGTTLSPKEIIRQQKPLHGNDSTSNSVGRRGSSASHNSDAMSNRDNHSSKANSPLMMRSPLAHQQQPQPMQNNGHGDS